MSASDHPADRDTGLGPVPSFVERHHTAYLVCVALAGWSLASCDFNLLVLTFNDIARPLHLAGYDMDQRGRKWMWMFCLTAARCSPA